MESWRDFWNPTVILGTAGTLGMAACAWPVARRWIASWCLLALLLAGLSWSEAMGHDLARGTFAISLIWGALLIALHWSSTAEDKAHAEPPLEESDTIVIGSAGALPSHGALPLQFVLLAGLCLMSQAGDLVTIFLGLQLLSIGSRVVVSPARTTERPMRDGWFPLPWLFLLGCVLLVAVTGSTRLETIAEALQTSYVNRESARYAIAGGGSRMLMLSVIFIGTALAGYAVCAPFHFQWWPTRLAPGGSDAVGCETYAPLLLLPRAAALLAWAKLWPGTIIASESTAQLLIGVLAAVTSVVPLLQARVERGLVQQWRLLAVAQGGWLLLGVAAMSFGRRPLEANGTPLVVEWNLPTAAQAAWFLLLLDGVAVLGLFGVLAYLRRRDRPVEFVDDLRGLWSCEPIAAVCGGICLLSLSGLPLLAGFWSRLLIALVAMNVRGEWGPPHVLIPHNGLLLLTALLAVSTVWSAAIAMRAVWTMFFGLPLGQPRPAGTASSLFAAVLASVILIGCGVLPGPLLSWLCAPRIEPQVPVNPAAGSWTGTCPFRQNLIGNDDKSTEHMAR